MYNLFLYISIFKCITYFCTSQYSSYQDIALLFDKAAFSDNMTVISRYNLSVFSAVANCVIICMLGIVIYRKFKKATSTNDV